MRTPTDQGPTEASALLIGANHRRLLGVLFMRPDQAFHTRELVRLSRMSSGTAHRELQRMARAGLVTHRRVGNQVQYQANRDCPIFPELQGIVRKTFGLAAVLREALQPLAARIELAFVFGSIAAGTDRAESDVDLLVVGDVGFAEVVEAIYPARDQLMREVNPMVLSGREFRQRRAESHGFTERVLSGPKLMLLGALDES